MQGKAALHDLVNSDDVTEILAADSKVDQVKAHVAKMQYGPKVRVERVDASSRRSIDSLMGGGHDVVVDLLPVAYHDAVTASAINNQVHLVNASYASARMKDMSAKAKAENVTVLPEFGMDPGIDLVLLGEAVRSFDEVYGITTYGAGFPELEAADNPLRYKVTWSFAGVLSSYLRAGRIVRDGETVEIADRDMFSPGYIHEIEIEDVGILEAFPNGDASEYAGLLGIETSQLRNMGRYVLRWPGHCAFWKSLVDLGFLDDEPLEMDGISVDRKRYLEKLLEPRIQYRKGERDVVVVRIEVTGRRAGKKAKAVFQVIDRRDLRTGITAMGRTVGYTASIGAQMIGTGQITKRGVLSPIKDIPYGPFAGELQKRNVQVTSEITAEN
jgi:saccharopine dehydrogenase-like NADP-dependent oxidoreductase